MALFRDAKRLADTLAQHGVAPETARGIVETFVFGMCVDLDQQPVVVDACSYAPWRALHVSEFALIADPDTFEWHDYAFGVVGEVFGDD